MGPDYKVGQKITDFTGESTGTVVGIETVTCYQYRVQWDMGTGGIYPYWGVEIAAIPGPEGQ